MCETISHKIKELLVNMYIKYIGTLAPEFIKVRSSLANYIVQFFKVNGAENWGKASSLQNCFYLIKAIMTT